MSAIFFDIDGTLWDRENNIPDTTREAIGLLKENGHLAFLSSGRMPVMIYDDRLLSMGFDGIIGGCGTYGEFRGSELYVYRLDNKLLHDTVKLLHEKDMAVMVEDTDVLFMDQGIAVENYGAYIKKCLGDRCIALDGDVEQCHGTKLTVLIFQKDYQSIMPILERDYHVLIHGAYVMELVPKGITKASGIQHVCRHLGIDVSDTYAVGDSLNDIAMIEYAGTGIAMGNGRDEVKAAADYVTDTLYEDGIYKALKHFGLI